MLESCGKYNEGSLDGRMVDITEFDTYEDFIDYYHQTSRG